jgi:hypothetical protein
MIKFDYKPLTRDEMWRAREIELLEAILEKLTTNQEVKIPDLSVQGVVKTEVKKKAPSKKKEVK